MLGDTAELKLFGLKNAIHHPKFLGRERYICAPNLGMAVVFISWEAPNMQKNSSRRTYLNSVPDITEALQVCYDVVFLVM